MIRRNDVFTFPTPNGIITRKGGDTLALKENLKAIRKKKKISQRLLAEKSGISYSMVCKLESGEQRNPSLETLEKIAAALDITPSDLMEGMDMFDQMDIILNSGVLDTLEHLVQSPSAIVHQQLRELLSSNQAIEFFSINSNAISPDEWDNIEADILDYIRFKFSRFQGKPSIYETEK